MSKLEKILKSLNPVNIAKTAVSTKAGRYTCGFVGGLILSAAVGTKTVQAEEVQTTFDNSLETTQIEDGPEYKEGKIENRVLGIHNPNGAEELYNQLRCLCKLDNDKNLGIDVSAGLLSDNDQDAFLIGVKGSYGQYFKVNNNELYAELNASLGFDNFENDDYKLRRFITGVGFRAGAANDFFIADLSFNYSWGDGKMTSGDDTFNNDLTRTEFKGQARLGRTSQFPIEIGFNYVKEDLDNICDQLAFTFGAGVLCKHESLNGKKALAKFQLHGKYKEMTSGNHSSDEMNFYWQAEYHLRVYENSEIMFAVVGTDNGNYQVAFSFMTKGKSGAKR